uniref:Cell growth regulator with ring finger domain 1 n=1 Tax=Sarcophilus harrisii TaxID=9305 RepID=A0A7N4P6U6_SARHA
MAAVFLVMLYEYSPLFYIAVVFTCFIVTTGLVLGWKICACSPLSWKHYQCKFQVKRKRNSHEWFGLEVPVILRNSEEIEFNTRVSKKEMKQVKNPFGLVITNPTSASITNLNIHWWHY